MSPNRERRETPVPPQTASTALEQFFDSENGPDFNNGVAVWLPGSKEMTNEFIGYLNMYASHLKCESKCYKFKMRTKLKGMIYLFRDQECTTKFYRYVSPHGDYTFLSQNLGTYLRAVAKIEDSFNLTRPDGLNVHTEIIIRNTHPGERVTKKVLRLSAIFGNVLRYVVYNDKGERYHFRHIAVRYRFATQAFAAKLGLDGKWIAEQKERPLRAEVTSNEKTTAICKELLRRDILIFQP